MIGGRFNRSQKELVLAHLQLGMPITPIKALAEYGVMRLAAVVYRLRGDGHNIIAEVRRSVSNKPYAEYRLCN